MLLNVVGERLISEVRQISIEILAIHHVAFKSLTVAQMVECLPSKYTATPNHPALPKNH
jgi:hypothetical protein